MQSWQKQISRYIVARSAKHLGANQRMRGTRFSVSIIVHASRLN